MLGRILFVTDLHKRYSDSASVHGQLIAQKLIQEDLIRIIKELEITHLCIAGDWYHRGFHGLCEAFDCMEDDKRISAAVNGNVYICAGNHLYLERDENPEMYIIQPNYLIKPKKKITIPERPVFNLVEDLRIGNVQVSFFHHTKSKTKKYVNTLQDGVTTHIGVYHDELCVPSHIAENEGYMLTSPRSVLDAMYENIDLAIHGHIHTKVGLVVHEDSRGKKTPMFVPGALGIVTKAKKHRHESVDLPVVTINDDSTIQVATTNVRTHMEVLEFYESAKTSEITDDERKQIQIQYENLSVNCLGDFLKTKGYNDTDLKIIGAAQAGALNITDIISSIAEEIKSKNSEMEIKMEDAI